MSKDLYEDFKRSPEAGKVKNYNTERASALSDSRELEKACFTFVSTAKRLNDFNRLNHMQMRSLDSIYSSVSALAGTLKKSKEKIDMLLRAALGQDRKILSVYLDREYVVTVNYSMTKEEKEQALQKAFFEVEDRNTYLSDLKKRIASGLTTFEGEIEKNRKELDRIRDQYDETMEKNTILHQVRVSGGFEKL